MYDHLSQFKDAVSRNAVMNDLFVFRHSHCHQLEGNTLPAFIPHIFLLWLRKHEKCRSASALVPLTSQTQARAASKHKCLQEG
jgi:hypothetical protein